MVRWLTFGALLVALAVLLVTGTAAPLNVAAAPVADLPDDLDRFLADREADTPWPLIEETDKRIVWRSSGERTRYAIVMLHGFSATRQETAPLGENIAAELNANLFETRLRGHGRQSGALAHVSAEDWLEDAAEALAIGARLGDEVIVIGVSTGATLALALAGHESSAAVSHYILISPNFRPANAAAGWVTAPGGRWLVKLMQGDEYSWTANNELQARYWTTRYPSDALIEMMRLVDGVRDRLPLSLPADLLTFVSPADRVVSVAATETALEKIEAPRKQLLTLDTVGDPSSHVLAGDILSPQQTDVVASAVVEFVRAADAPLSPAPPAAP